MEQQIIQGLVNRGMSLAAARGAVANMIVESNLNPGINEIAPVVEGSRGGYGLNQWTGPRRVQYEQFARGRGVDPSDLDAQLDFTIWELANTEKAAGNALLGAETATDAAQIYSNKFLRPGIPHLGRRMANAQRLSQQQQQPQQPQQNAIAAQQQPQNALRFNAPQGQAFQMQQSPNQLVNLLDYL